MNSASHGQLLIQYGDNLGPSHTPLDYRGHGQIYRGHGGQYMLHHNTCPMQTSSNTKTLQIPAMGGNQLGVTLYEVSLISKMRKLRANGHHCRQIVGDIFFVYSTMTLTWRNIFREHIQARQLLAARKRVSRSLSTTRQWQDSSITWTHFWDMLIHGGYSAVKCASCGRYMDSAHIRA